jgi:hypothetical protein
MNESTYDDRIHLRIWQLIPWVVNQTASVSEQAEVESHLHHCEICRSELALQQDWKNSLNVSEGAVYPDVEAGLSRLSQRIDTPRPVSRPRLLAVAYGLGALVLLQSGVLTVLGMKMGASDTPSYRTLSAAENASMGATIRLVIDPAASVGQLQALLAPLNLQIVAGPSDSGVYSLGPRALEQGGGSPHADIKRQIDALRAAPVVRFAEPVVQNREGA